MTGSARYFYFWCENCPTRITIETEVPAASADGDPEYTFASHVGLARVREPTPHDDGTEMADLCPACGSLLHDVDELVAYGDVPPNCGTPDAHAIWRAARNK
jgi:hypothetical protein